MRIDSALLAFHQFQPGRQRVAYPSSERILLEEIVFTGTQYRSSPGSASSLGLTDVCSARRGLSPRSTFSSQEGNDEHTGLRRMPQEPTSLLSLPDELLVQTFDYLADPPTKGIHPLWSLTHVCRQVREVAQTVLYRYASFGPGWDATPHFQAAVTQNPSLGQLVSSLDMHDNANIPYFFQDGSLRRKTRAVLRTLTKLKELSLWEVTTDEAASILAALPSPPIRVLDLRLYWTENPSHWRDLQTQLSRFSQLHDLCVLDAITSSPELAQAPRATRRSPRHLSLPQVVKLHVVDYVLVEGFGSAGLLRQTLPNLRELHLYMSLSENVSAVSASLADLSSSLTTLELLGTETWGITARYIPDLPALRCLEFGYDSFTEAEVLAFLPKATASLESIVFDLSDQVTDRVLRALTGRERPPRLRHLRLNHISARSPDDIRDQVERRGWEGKDAEEVRSQLHPHWAIGATVEGLRLALADADANGIQVTGSALDCANWDATFDKVFAEYAKEGGR